MSARRYSLPECLKDLVPEDQYRKWLQRKAQALAKRDRKRGNSQATIAIYKEAIHQAIHRDGPCDWYTGEELEWRRIGTYRNDVAKKVGRDIKRQMSQLPTIDHEDDGLGDTSIRRVPYIPMLREDNVRKGFFEHAEFLALRDALPDHLKGFVTFGYKTGWRFSEIARLTWNPIDLSQNTARLEAGETKNREGRTVWPDDEVKAVIQEQGERRKKANKLMCYVFTNKDGDGRIKDFRGTWRSACKKAGLGHRLFHDLRRTAVRNMVRAGVPERVAMTISGHKTRSVFERYNIVDEKDLQLAAERQHAYLELRLGTKPGTIVDLDKKRSQPNEG
jgi:integrase